MRYEGGKPLKRLVVLDSDGKEVAYRRLEEPRSGRRTDSFRASFSATDGQGVDRCTVRATYFDVVERVVVGVVLEVGPGL